MNTNVKGIYLLSKFTIPVMINHGGGAIINMGSDSGLVGQRDAHAYSASKGAVINLTRAMAISYGIHGIRVNCVCPSLVKTPMTQKSLTKERCGKSAQKNGRRCSHFDDLENPWILHMGVCIWRLMSRHGSHVRL